MQAILRASKLFSGDCAADEASLPPLVVRGLCTRGLLLDGQLPDQGWNALFAIHCKENAADDPQIASVGMLHKPDTLIEEFSINDFLSPLDWKGEWQTDITR